MRSHLQRSREALLGVKCAECGKRQPLTEYRGCSKCGRPVCETCLGSKRICKECSA